MDVSGLRKAPRGRECDGLDGGGEGVFLRGEAKRESSAQSRWIRIYTQSLTRCPVNQSPVIVCLYRMSVFIIILSSFGIPAVPAKCLAVSSWAWVCPIPPSCHFRCWYITIKKKCHVSFEKTMFDTFRSRKTN